jgi:hypothetical protein
MWFVSPVVGWLKSFAANWIIAVATCVYTFFAIEQWSELRASNEINRNSLLALQPAQIIYSGLNVMPFQIYSGLDDQQRPVLIKTPGIAVSPIWLNIGNTRAKHVHVYFGDPIKTVSPTERPDMRIPSDIKFVPIVLGPKARENGAFKPLSQDEMTKIRNGELHIYLWGEATYADIFPGTNMHVTQFCQDISGIISNNNNNENVGILTQACMVHNCIDEDCKAGE